MGILIYKNKRKNYQFYASLIGEKKTVGLVST